MDNNSEDFTITDYLNFIKNAQSFNDTINYLVVIFDFMKQKNVSYNKIMELIEALGYGSMLKSIDPIILDSNSGSPTKSEVALVKIDKLFLSKLVNCYAETKCSKAIHTICNVSSLQLENTWINDLDSLDQILISLTKELAHKQRKESFEVCEYLAYIIPSVPRSKLRESAAEPWQQYLHKGLCNMILSKLTAKYRQTALKLACTVFDCFDMDWLLDQDRGKELFIATVNLAYIEIKLCLESKSYKDAVACYVDLKSWFTIVEIASHHLICELSALLDANILQLNETLQKVTDIIIKFISHNLPIHPKPNTISELFTLLTVKTIGALIADEDRSTSEYITDVLPFIMETITYQFNKRENSEPLYNIAPALCLLTGEERPCQVLLQHNVEGLLMKYIECQWDSCLNDQILDTSILGNNSSKIQVAFNVLLNIITNQRGRLTSTPVYGQLMDFILAKSPAVPRKGEFLALFGVFCTFGTLILFKRSELCPITNDSVFCFVRQTITFLWEAFEVRDHSLTISEDFEPFWEDVTDAWLLTMNGVCELIKMKGWVAQYCIDSEWMATFVDKFLRVTDASVDIAVKVSYEQVFVWLYIYDRAAVDQNQLKLVAKKHNMTELAACVA